MASQTLNIQTEVLILQCLNACIQPSGQCVFESASNNCVFGNRSGLQHLFEWHILTIFIMFLTQHGIFSMKLS